MRGPIPVDPRVCAISKVTAPGRGSPGIDSSINIILRVGGYRPCFLECFFRNIADYRRNASVEQGLRKFLVLPIFVHVRMFSRVVRTGSTRRIRIVRGTRIVRRFARPRRRCGASPLRLGGPDRSGRGEASAGSPPAHPNADTAEIA